MLTFVNISAYLGCYACLFLLLKALKTLLLKVRALLIMDCETLYRYVECLLQHCNNNNWWGHSNSLYTDTLFPVYKHAVPFIKTHCSLYMDMLFPLYRHTVPFIQKHCSFYMGTLFPLYRHTVPFPLHRHALLFRQTHCSFYIDTLFPLYRHTVPFIQKHCSFYMGTLFPLYRHTVSSYAAWLMMFSAVIILVGQLLF